MIDHKERGHDFLAISASWSWNGEVLQTFLSSSESDQTQIQGRTARKGNYGEYQLILCSESHLYWQFLGQLSLGFFVSQLPCDD